MDDKRRNVYRLNLIGYEIWVYTENGFTWVVAEQSVFPHRRDQLVDRIGRDESVADLFYP